MLTSIPTIRPATAGRELDGFIRAVLDIVLARTGVDFSCYRAQMLERRVLTRMAAAGAGSFDEYLRLLATSESEPARLLERITIKVSRFYRHAPTFNYLRNGLLRELASERGGEPLRIWSAGCGGGEEAYTFAMLLDHLGLEGHIEATDLDPAALTLARAGVFPISATAELPVELSSAYLEPIVEAGHARYRVREDLAGRVRFSTHDVTSGGPPPGEGPFDLVSCRNVLIYLQRPAQAAATRRLLNAIRDNGVLCLGEAECPLPELQELFAPLPHKTRLFRFTGPAPFAADNDLNRARVRAGA